jgi:hypothetical protein
MPVIITQEGRISVPKTRERPGERDQTLKNNIIVKTNGWVKYRKNGEIHHLPPNQVKEIQERDLDVTTSTAGNEEYDSHVTHSSPHGRV